jgi:NNP family nitrate/nitrite transporter-like MFS transporter
VGGWLADRFGPARVLAAALTVVCTGAAVQAFTPGLVPVGTAAFLAMAAAPGAGSGATFALVALLAPPTRSAQSPASSVPRAASAASSRRW